MAGAVSVLDILQRRKQESSVHGRRNDPHKLWLVVEGGGQAGAIMGGFATALERLGYTECFDGIVGTSAGAMTGAYFAAGAAAHGTTIYPEDNTDGRFLNAWRLLWGNRPVLDLDYLVDRVMAKVKPLPMEVLRAMRRPVLAVATNRDGQRALLPLHGQDERKVLEHMKTSALLPLWASLKFAHQPLWDGALKEPVPLPAAVEQGATHVLHLSRRCATANFCHRDGWLDRLLVHPLLQTMAPDIARIYHERAAQWEARFCAARDRLAGYQRLALQQPRLGVATLDKVLIWGEIRRAYAHAAAWLGEPDAPVPGVWTRSQAAL